MSQPPSRAAPAPTSARAPSYLTPLREATRKVQLEGTSCEKKGVPEGCWEQGEGSGDGGEGRTEEVHRCQWGWLTGDFTCFLGSSRLRVTALTGFVP